MRTLRVAFVLGLKGLLLATCDGGAADPHVLPLAGKWRFALDRQDAGVAEHWEGRQLPGRVRVPVDLAAQGIGAPPSLETKWIGGIKEKWYLQPELAPYSKPDKFKFPYWLTPERRYMGVAWYQRNFRIPDKWADQRVVLFLERPHWETRVWIDGACIGANNALGTPHEYDLGVLAPGNHQLTICVDNRLVVDIGINSHSISDHTQGDWSGIVGAVELRATPRVWIEETRVEPDLERGSFHLKGKIGNITGKNGAGELHVQISDGPESRANRSVPLRWDVTGGNFEAEIKPAGTLRTWDEFDPHIYRIELTLGGQTQVITTGARSIATSGTQFVVNGRKTFFRGTLECAIFPKTGHPPTDVAAWERILRIARAHGLNMLRFHSWCPPEAAFTAADRLGFYYQVEASSWANQSTTLGDGKPVDAWIYEETARILRTYGNHPCFVLMPYGNEPGGRNAIGYLARWETHFRKEDPRRLYTSGSGWPQIPENQFHVTPDPRIQAWGQGLKSRINAKPPETLTDYSDYIGKRSVPVISHEIGQWCVYPNFEEIPKYTGYLKARNFEIFRDSLKAHHMEDLSDLFLKASGKLQTLCYKEDIESALRTHGMGGFQLLDLHDFPGQGTALVGVLDPFWESKGYVTAQEYSRFCNAVVPLARLPRRVYSEGDHLVAAMELSNFGSEPLANAVLEWRLISENGRSIKSGSLGPRTAPVDNGIAFGSIETGFDGVRAPCRLKLVVKLAGSKFENDWDLWLYPKQPAPSIPDEILVIGDLNESARQALAGGGKVLLMIPPRRVQPDPELGRIGLGFSSIFWNTAWTGRQPPHTLGIWCDPAHPLFAQFPTEFHSNWQWWYLIHRAGAMIMEDFPKNLRPLVGVIDDWTTNRRLGLLFEARVGRGKLVVCSIDLATELESDPVRKQFLRSLVAFMSSSRFSPGIEVDPVAIQGLIRRFTSADKLGVRRITADSAEEGNEAENAIDGNPDTIWHTEYRETKPAFPHYLEVELEKEEVVAGFALLPRQDGNPNGLVHKFEAFLSVDGTNWGPAIITGSFPRGGNEARIMFKSPRKCRFFKLVMDSGYGKGPWASAAELSLLPPQK